MILYDTQRSGNAWKIRLLAGFLGVPLQRRTLSIDRGDFRAPDFLRRVPFAQVPALEFEDGEVLGESTAILHHLAQGTAWWPEDARAQARALSWMSFEQERHMPPLAQLRLRLALHRDSDPASPAIHALTARARHALSLLEARLAAAAPGAWVATTGHPSIADLALYPYTRFAPMGGIELEAYPAITGWAACIRALPGYQPLFPGRPDMDLATEEHRPA